MKEEIDVAVSFLIRVIAKNSCLERSQLEALRERLKFILVDRFRDHWFPEKPSRGQAYRCIRINDMEPREPVLERASRQCSLAYEELCLPAELTLWVDPEEVCCRFGERRNNSYCILATFKGGRRDNYVDQINIDELKPAERSKQVISKANPVQPYHWQIYAFMKSLAHLGKMPSLQLGMLNFRVIVPFIFSPFVNVPPKLFLYRFQHHINIPNLCRWLLVIFSYMSVG